MKVSPDYYDEIFDFKGEWDMPSSCGLKIRESEGRQYVIVTELYQDNPGTSVTYAGQRLAEQICQAKGLELNSLMRMSEVIKDVLPNQNVVILSGPTLAKEVLMGKPTAASVACEDIETAEFVQKALNVPGRFRLYTNTDVIGVELGGSLKNVIAIASGFAHAMDLGDNCMGTLLTRGMAEIVRLSVKLGANPSTLYGLSGMGDLIATCSSPMSRNYTVGSMLGQGKKIDDILATLGSVAEGVKTSKAVCDLAQKLGIEVPVSSAIYEAVYTDITPQEVLSKLMNRKLKKEECYDKIRG